MKIIICAVMLMLLSLINSDAGVHVGDQLFFEFTGGVRNIFREQNKTDIHENCIYYIEGRTQWIGGNKSYGVNMYDSDAIPDDLKLKIIEYCISFHKKHRGQVRVSVRQSRDKFKPSLSRTYWFVMKIDVFENN